MASINANSLNQAEGSSAFATEPQASALKLAQKPSKAERRGLCILTGRDYPRKKLVPLGALRPRL